MIGSCCLFQALYEYKIWTRKKHFRGLVQPFDYRRVDKQTFAAKTRYATKAITASHFYPFWWPVLTVYSSTKTTNLVSVLVTTIESRLTTGYCTGKERFATPSHACHTTPMPIYPIRADHHSQNCPVHVSDLADRCCNFVLADWSHEAQR